MMGTNAVSGKSEGYPSTQREKKQLLAINKKAVKHILLDMNKHSLNGKAKEQVANHVIMEVNRAAIEACEKINARQVPTGKRIV